LQYSATVALTYVQPPTPQSFNQQSLTSGLSLKTREISTDCIVALSPELPTILAISVLSLQTLTGASKLLKLTAAKRLNRTRDLEAHALACTLLFVSDSIYPTQGIQYT
jgi:hypothetical protein